MERNWNPQTLTVRMRNVTVALETVWQFPRMLNTELSYDPGIPLLSTCPMEVRVYFYIKIHIQITVFTLSLRALFTSHHLARFPVHELSATVVVVVVSLDASRQCGLLVIR